MEGEETREPSEAGWERSERRPQLELGRTKATMGGGGGDGVTDTRTQKAEETKGLQSSEWPRPHHSLLSLCGARCGSVSEDEKTFLSWSLNVSVCVVYVFLVTFNSHVQISCPGFKIYFLTGRYGNRPFQVLLTGSYITATTFNHSLLKL